MPKEVITPEIQVQWARGGRLVCILINEGENNAMWQSIDSREIDKLIKVLRRAKRHTFS